METPPPVSFSFLKQVIYCLSPVPRSLKKIYSVEHFRSNLTFYSVGCCHVGLSRIVVLIALFASISRLREARMDFCAEKRSPKSRGGTGLQGTTTTCYMKLKLARHRTDCSTCCLDVNLAVFHPSGTQVIIKRKNYCFSLSQCIHIAQWELRHSIF